MTFIPSSQQQAVIDWTRDGSGSLFLRARAGTGKTTTLVQMLTETGGSVAFAAYNRKIADEIKAKCAPLGLGNRVRVGTFHSFGLSAWKRAYPQVKSGPEAAREKAEMTKAKFREVKAPETLDSFTLKLVSLAKQRALGLFGSIDDKSIWYDIVDHFDLAYEIENEELIDQGVDLAIRTIRWQQSIASKIIDFDDMVYSPLIAGTRFWQNDWVFVDEAQDTNPARRALARRMLRPSGRAAFVGDDRQAIYGFCHPAGTPVLTPMGWRPIEELKKNSKVIAFNTSGDVAGWNGGNRVLAAHRYSNKFGYLMKLRVGDRSVRLTPHHRLPVKISKAPQWFTYMMERNGAFRVGYCASHARAGEGERRFMFANRCKTEKAERGWLLRSFSNKAAAQRHEAQLIREGVTGATFNKMTDAQVAKRWKSRPRTEIAAQVLVDNGRHADFPLWRADRRHHFEIGLPFITEACNVVAGMRAQVLGEWDKRKRGRARHTGEWLPVRVHRYKSDEPTYGITIQPIAGRVGYSNPPLYAAGSGVIMHNTGADSDAIEQIIRDFNCRELPLTVTRRCPKDVVALAQSIVPDIEAHEEAPQGIVSTVAYPDFEKNTTATLTAADAILCRVTKPLVKLAFDLIKKGVACHVEGRDIGAGLIKLVDRYKSARSLQKLIDLLDGYAEREVARLMSKGREVQAEAVQDRVDTVKVVAENCDTVDCVRSKITSMFQDADNEAKPTLTLATVHRSKGREWERVFILGRNTYMPSPWARQAWQQHQEANLIYVAYTRTKRELTMVDVVA